MLRFNGPTESLLTPAKRTLEMIAGRASLAGILTNLCAVIDAQSPDIISNWPEEHI